MEAGALFLTPSNGFLIPLLAAQRRTSMLSAAQSENSGVLGPDPNAPIRLIYQILRAIFLLNEICFIKQDPGPRSYPRVSSLLEPKSSTDMVFSPLPYYWHLLCSLTKSKNGPNSIFVASNCHQSSNFKFIFASMTLVQGPFNSFRF